MARSISKHCEVELVWRAGDLKDCEADLSLSGVVQAERTLTNFGDRLSFKAQGVAVGESASERNKILKPLGADSGLVEKLEKPVAA